MFRVITQNSVYLVTPMGNGFSVKRVADMWGRQVKDNHYHVTKMLNLTIGRPMYTDGLTTSAVMAVTPAAQ